MPISKAKILSVLIKRHDKGDTISSFSFRNKASPPERWSALAPYDRNKFNLIFFTNIDGVKLRFDSSDVSFTSRLNPLSYMSFDKEKQKIFNQGLADLRAEDHLFRLSFYSASLKSSVHNFSNNACAVTLEKMCNSIALLELYIEAVEHFVLPDLRGCIDKAKEDIISNL